MLILGRCCVLCVVVLFVKTELIHDEYKTSNVIVDCCVLLALLFVVGLLLMTLLFAVC